MPKAELELGKMPNLASSSQKSPPPQPGPLEPPKPKPLLKLGGGCVNRICGIGRLLGGRARLLGIQELLLTDLKLTNMLELNSVYIYTLSKSNAF